jgi:hypothetical protein
MSVLPRPIPAQVNLDVDRVVLGLVLVVGLFFPCRRVCKERGEVWFRELVGLRMIMCDDGILRTRSVNTVDEDDMI